MDIDEFLGELAEGDSNDREIECLQDALREAYALIPSGAPTEAFEARLDAILAES